MKKRWTFWTREDNGVDMARPNYGAWPNPCAREV